jgi:hypothetical protein
VGLRLAAIMRSGAPFLVLLMAGAVAISCRPGALQAQAPVSPPLGGVAFGQVASITGDAINRQNTCSYGGLTPVIYSVTGTGSGPGSAFSMTNGTSILPYEVQWAQSANAASGSSLTAGRALLNQSNASLLSSLTCGLGLQNATLIVIVRAVSLQQATAGIYSGTLSLLLSVQ